MKKTLIIFLLYLIICPFIPFWQTTLSAERSALRPKPAAEVVEVKGKSGNNVMQDKLDKPKLPVRVDIQMTEEKGVFYGAEPISATLHVINETDEEVKAILVAKIKLDVGKKVTTKKTAVIIPAGGMVDQVISQKVTEPGFYQVTTTLVYNKEETPEMTFTLGYEPEKMAVKCSAPADYMSFWNNSLAELAKVDPNYTVTLVPDRCTLKLNVYDVRMKSFGNVEVGGQYVVPKAPGKYPVIVQFLGYGSIPKGAEMKDDGFIRYLASTRGQGVMNKENIYGDWMAYRLDSRDDYYYRGAFLDVVRAIDFVCSRPEADQTRVVVRGGSQGGALSFAAAALDKRIALCVPHIPGFCDIPNFINLTSWPGSVYRKYVSDNDKKVTFQSMCNMLTYFDVKNFGPLIHCPVFMGIGLQDPICPPRTTFAPYNLLTVKDKRYIIYPECKHAVRYSDFSPETDVWIRTHFGMVTAQTGDGQVFTPKETFTDSDKPDTIKLQTLKLTTPWGYNKTENAERKYPLVVNGNWGEGNLFREDVRKKYPSFYLDFNHHTTESDGATLATLIDEAIRTNYRIDTNRIYLTGFSAGGSGSFKIVRGMLSKGKLFAGIVRVAGQSESLLADEAVKKTSLWYHIGLKDLTERIDVARATYMNLKGKTANATAVESITTDNVTGYTRSTKTLTKNGIEIIKMSEYEGLGHEPGPCYKDPALFDWLFSQSLAHR